jgi:hypothetical protein
MVPLRNITNGFIFPAMMPEVPFGNYNSGFYLGVFQDIVFIFSQETNTLGFVLSINKEIISLWVH